MKEINVEELKRYYIEENHSKEETRKHFKVTDWALSKLFKNYNIRKPKSSVSKLCLSTKKSRYGSENYNNRLKFKETEKERYGGIGFASDICRSKSNNTTEVRYGNRDIRKTTYFKNKASSTKQIRYGDANYNNREKIKETLKERYGFENPVFTHIKSSEPEQKVREALKAHSYRIKNREFDVKLGNTLIEVDGEFWHPSTVQNLKLTQVRNLVNDYEKEQLAKREGFELVRIHTGNIPEKITLESLKEKDYRPSYSIEYSDYIVTPETLKKFIGNYGKDTLERDFFPDMLAMVRLCSPNFPKIPKEESLQEAIDYLRNTDHLKYYRAKGRFTFNSSNVGSNVLKSRFNSFWKASNRGKLSPVEAWKCDEVMNKIIRYRVGINNTGECYGLSLKQIIKGLNVNHFLVSFFKPTIAAAIYRHYLGNVKQPVVFDPSAGFGARLLAFKSLYPEGTYIGCEPNPETYQELQDLVKEAGFSKVILYPQKLEDLKSIPEYDFGFTSPPYFDLETYSVPVNYVNFEEWKSTFWNKLINLPNMYVNINMQLWNLIQSDQLCTVDIISKNRNPVGTNQKNQELIIKRLN